METNATGIDLVKLFQAYEEARADNTAHFRKIMALQKRVEELEAENKKMRDALSKFSDPNFYWTKPPTVEDGWIVYGRAKKTAELLNAARQALGEAKNGN